MLRSEVWIPKIRSVTKSVIHECELYEHILRPQLDQPGPPVLPPERVTYKRPFLDVGLDYSGAILIKDPDFH